MRGAAGGLAVPVRTVAGRHGSFLCIDTDTYVGRSLLAYGEYSEAEAALLLALIGPGAVVVEGGANIGALTVPMAKAAGRAGRVYAFEPQRLIFHLLCGNLALNEIENTHAFAMALGDRPGQARIPLTSYAESANFGGIAAGDGSGPGEAVSVGTVDALRLPRLDLLKADVEGAETQLLRGAADTIARCRPVLYVENDRKAASPGLLDLVRGMGYAAWWHTPRLFNADNFAHNRADIFGPTASINILCVPDGAAAPNIAGLRPVRDREEWPI